MAIRQLGLRYERLLILSAPISLACILVAFIAVASEEVSGEKTATCYDKAASIVESHLHDLELKWEQREKIGDVEFANTYVSALSRYMIYGLRVDCDYKIGSQDTSNSIAPASFAEKLKAQAKNIREESAKKPVRSYGIEMPEKANIGIFGTIITVNALTLAQVMQITLGPILLLWLGSLFNTRYRETILIEAATSISDLHPHCINIYLNAKLPDLRKRSVINYYLKKTLPYTPTLFRLLLLAIFIVPPTLFYCASLYYLVMGDYQILNILAGLLVFSFAFVNLASEMSPWHAGKIFPGPGLYHSS